MEKKKSRVDVSQHLRMSGKKMTKGTVCTTEWGKDLGVGCAHECDHGEIDDRLCVKKSSPCSTATTMAFLEDRINTIHMQPPDFL